MVLREGEIGISISTHPAGGFRRAAGGHVIRLNARAIIHLFYTRGETGVSALFCPSIIGTFHHYLSSEEGIWKGIQGQELIRPRIHWTKKVFSVGCVTHFERIYLWLPIGGIPLFAEFFLFCLSCIFSPNETRRDIPDLWKKSKAKQRRQNH